MQFSVTDYRLLFFLHMHQFDSSLERYLKRSKEILKNDIIA